MKAHDLIRFIILSRIDYNKMINHRFNHVYSKIPQMIPEIIS